MFLKATAEGFPRKLAWKPGKIGNLVFGKPQKLAKRTVTDRVRRHEAERRALRGNWQPQTARAALVSRPDAVVRRARVERFRDWPTHDTVRRG